VLGEALVDESQEILGISTERLGCQHGELVLNLLAHWAKFLDPRSMRCPFALELCSE
jgi:hypothetical protein